MPNVARSEMFAISERSARQVGLPYPHHETLKGVEQQAQQLLNPKEPINDEIT